MQVRALWLVAALAALVGASPAVAGTSAPCGAYAKYNCHATTTHAQHSSAPAHHTKVCGAYAHYRC